MDDNTSRAEARYLTRLGHAVREIREERGLSEHELANAVRGISLAGIRAIEAGNSIRSLDYIRLLRLADALDVKPAALFRRADRLSVE